MKARYCEYSRCGKLLKKSNRKNPTRFCCRNCRIYDQNEKRIQLAKIGRMTIGNNNSIISKKENVPKKIDKIYNSDDLIDKTYKASTDNQVDTNVAYVKQFDDIDKIYQEDDPPEYSMLFFLRYKCYTYDELKKLKS